MLNKTQYQDLRALLLKESASTAILPAAQTILGIDPRNPSQIAKLIADLKLGEVDLTFDEGVAIVTLAGSEGRHADSAVALLRAMVAAVEQQALDARFPEKKSRSPEKAVTPDRGFGDRPAGRR